MCRNIRPLHNYEPASTEQDAHDAALQYVRKVSGMNKPARVNEEAFQRAVEASCLPRLGNRTVTNSSS